MRLATYNLLHGRHLGAGGRVDLAAAAERIAALDADVVVLQEVDRRLARTGEVHQVAWLADALGLVGAFAPALLGSPDTAWSTPTGGDTGGPAYGVGVLSRWAVDDSAWLTLPGGGDGRRRRPATPQRPGWDREPRVALRVTVAAPGGSCTLTTTHLSYLPWRAVRQLRAALRFADGQRAALLGDLNLPPGPVARLARGWRQVRAAPTYPAWAPRVQVDQALLRGLRPRAWEVPPHTTSDHRPLVVDVTAPGPGAWDG